MSEIKNNACSSPPYVVEEGDSTGTNVEEFAPKNNPDLLEFKNTFQYNDVVADNVLTKVIDEYESAFNKKPK